METSGEIKLVTCQPPLLCQAALLLAFLSFNFPLQNLQQQDLNNWFWWAPEGISKSQDCTGSKGYLWDIFNKQQKYTLRIGVLVCFPDSTFCFLMYICSIFVKTEVPIVVSIFSWVLFPIPWIYVYTLELHSIVLLLWFPYYNMKLNVVILQQHSFLVRVLVGIHDLL